LNLRYKKWRKSLPNNARNLLDSHYPSLIGWINYMRTKISEGQTDFAIEFELFEEFKNEDKNVIIKYLLHILKKDWQAFSENNIVFTLLKIIFSNTHNIQIISCFRNLLIKAYLSNANKIYDLAVLGNTEDEEQINQRRKLDEAFVALVKICDEELSKFFENLIEGLKAKEFVVDESIKLIAEELIADFELSNFEDFKNKFKGLKSEEQKIVLNYILGIHIADGKSFSDIGQMTNYIHCIILLFKEVNNDLSLVLEFLLNFYDRTADFIYTFGSLTISAGRWPNGDKIVFPPFSPKFFLIYQLIDCVIDQQIIESLRLFESEDILNMTANTVGLYYLFGDYRLLKEFIQRFFLKSCICFHEQADKVLISKFIKFINQLKNGETLDAKFFERLKNSLLLYVEAASITNKEEITNLLSESLKVN